MVAIRPGTFQELVEHFIGYGVRAVDVRVLDNCELPQMGLCWNLRDASTVVVNVPSLRRVLSLGVPIGGNQTVPRSIEESVLLVFMHELRHVMQYVGSGHPQWLPNVDYWDQPHEVDARRFVDLYHGYVLDALDGSLRRPTEFSASGMAWL